MRFDKAVILAAGRATRMGRLCDTIHKCMLPVAGKPLLEWNMEKVFDLVEEYILVVGYRQDDIKKYFGSNFKGKRITYVTQNEQLGTGHALLQVGRIDGKFILLMGDDWYPKMDVPNELAIFAQKVENTEKFGVLESNNGKLVGIAEKCSEKRSGLVNTGFYVLDSSIFDELQHLKKSVRGELELTDSVVSLASKKNVKVVEINGWKGIAYPWELLSVNSIALNELEWEIKGTTEERISIIGNVSIGEGSKILSGTRIEGPVCIGRNCIIGPNCYLRPGTSIGNNCRIGNSCEVKNSIIMDGSNIAHLSYVGDSIIARNCNLGGGTIIANSRFDGKTVKCNAKGRIDTGLKKFGAVMCDNVKTGINVSIMPGVVISSENVIMPGEVVKRDV